MLVTFTNASSVQIFISELYKQLDAGESVTTRRALYSIGADQELQKMIQDGDVTIAFTWEDGDNAKLIPGNTPPTYNNTTRIDASLVPLYTFIWNTDDNAYNFSDGVNWRTADGLIT